MALKKKALGGTSTASPAKPSGGLGGLKNKLVGTTKRKLATGAVIAGVAGGGGMASGMFPSLQQLVGNISIDTSEKNTTTNSNDQSHKSTSTTGDTSVKNKEVGGDDNSKNINTGNVTTEGDVNF